MIPAYIALGSNLGDPARQLKTALEALADTEDSTLVDCSPVYQSLAIGPGDQPDYLNAVARLDTTLAPLALLRRLQSIEAAQGRERGERWAARTLDLDLLLYADEVMDSAALTLPHPRLKERNFVLAPLADLAPELRLPCGTPIGSLLERCSLDGLSLYESPTLPPAAREA